MKTELDSAWESAIHNAERARKAEADIERLQAELAEAKKFKDGMLDVLGGACPNDHRSTPFEEFKGCTPCLRAELAEWRKDAERYRWLRDKCRDGSLTIARADDWSLHPWSGDDIDKEIDAARKGEGE
jgi:hypothetical protein